MLSPEKIKQSALDTINIEATAIQKLSNFIDDNFVKAVVEIFNTKGKVIVTGIGKSAIIAQKLVSSLNSTGTMAQFLHAADALHGDIGMISQKDCIICISKSGETPEIKVLLPILKDYGNSIIAITGNVNSTMAMQSNIVLNAEVDREASPNNLAPTTSCTAQLVVCDALVTALIECRGFKASDFAKVHPGGTLGKRLYLRVSDLYINNQRPVVDINTDLKTVIYEISSKLLGSTAVMNGNELVGIITDGDLRRMLSKSDFDINSIKASDIMTLKPKTVSVDLPVISALEIMRKNSITQLLVVDKNQQYVGVIHIHDIIREGII